MDGITYLDLGEISEYGMQIEYQSVLTCLEYKSKVVEDSAIDAKKRLERLHCLFRGNQDIALPGNSLFVIDLSMSSPDENWKAFRLAVESPSHRFM